MQDFYVHLYVASWNNNNNTDKLIDKDKSWIFPFKNAQASKILATVHITIRFELSPEQGGNVKHFTDEDEDHCDEEDDKEEGKPPSVA